MIFDLAAARIYCTQHTNCRVQTDGLPWVLPEPTYCAGPFNNNDDFSNKRLGQNSGKGLAILFYSPFTLHSYAQFSHSAAALGLATRQAGGREANIVLPATAAQLSVRKKRPDGCWSAGVWCKVAPGSARHESQLLG